MKRKINVWGSPSEYLLKTPSKDVDVSNKELVREKAEVLKEFYEKNYGHFPVGGLSFSQIALDVSECLRMFVLKGGNKLHTITNPVITSQAKYNYIARIGCFSAANAEKALQLAPEWISLRYYDVEAGEFVYNTFSYPVTNPLVHEIRHLAGGSYADDALAGSVILTAKELAEKGADTDEKKLRILLGNHPLAQYYNGEEKVQHLKEGGQEIFLINDERYVF